MLGHLHFGERFEPDPMILVLLSPPEAQGALGRYLIVWTVAIGTDWLQGPYVYALSRRSAELPSQSALVSPDAANTSAFCK